MQFVLDSVNEICSRDAFIDLLDIENMVIMKEMNLVSQTRLHKLIAKHQNPRDIYAEKLVVRRGDRCRFSKKSLEKEYKDNLDQNSEASAKDLTIITYLMQNEWKGVSSSTINVT
jgi:2-oxoglutarate dehydrogenase E1 component